MTGRALLLTADHADPAVAALEARRRLIDRRSDPVDDERVVAAVVDEGFSEPAAREAVATSSGTDGDPTRSCARDSEPYASDD